ncbi:hypothetical protein ACFX19_041123 [Malus domestica]
MMSSMLFKNFFTQVIFLRSSILLSLPLSPKVSVPATMRDFRPISCCNTLYKIIAKSVANRLKEVLSPMVSLDQLAFIPGRKIGDSILLAQEILGDYHEVEGSPRCALKVDLMKAYDTVEWDFILSTLVAFAIPPTMINWIKSCISSPMFSIVVNGELVGYFGSMRGLRQGDPLSPYLFVIAMEMLSHIINVKVRSSPLFRFHWWCEIIGLTHLCFADDILMVYFEDEEFAQVLYQSLCNFQLLSRFSLWRL